MQDILAIISGALAGFGILAGLYITLNTFGVIP